MFPCMKKTPAKTSTPASHEVGAIKLALVIGHNKKAQGAVNYLGESEYKFNKRIAQKVALLMWENYQVKVMIIERPSGVGYSKECAEVAKIVKDNGIGFVISTHFNDGPAGAMGCEALIVNTASALDNDVAAYLVNKLNSELGLRNRGVKTIPNNHNGAGMLNAIKNAGALAVLVEPCFADNRNESKVIFENEDNYVKILAATLKSVGTYNKLI